MNNMTISPELQLTLTNLPLEPGVYRMRDMDGKVIYVGKATCLKKRVQSYFSQSDQGSKTRALVRQIASIDVSVTRSETEALLLESQLIKSLRPKYNVLMRDDKSYPYLYVSLKHNYPSLSMVRTKKNPQEKGYFGPYPGVNAVRETLNMIQKVFKLRNCRDGDFATRSRPCLQYQIGRCGAPCVDLISKADYEQAVQDTTQFLRGKSQQLLNELGQRMNEAVDKMAFEEAAQLRDQMKHLRLIQEQQGMTLREGDADVMVSYVRPGFACVQWVGVRGGQVLDSQVFFPTLPKAGLEQEDLEQAVFEAFIAHYYFDTPARIPALILTNHPVQEQAAWEKALRVRREKACKIQINPRGSKARWLDFANDNLERAVAARRASKLLIEQRYEVLQQALSLTSISRMVCFDISHTQGQDAVASCVVFDKQGPCKSAYRRLNIKNITPGDDYAAMEQAVARYFKRLLRDEKPLPELAVIDGGKGQVSMAKQALDALGITNVKILGVAKGPARKAGLERLVLADDFLEMSWAPESPALHLLQHIRDESHRFAITAHRKKRQKTAVSSTLNNIPGVGEKRRHALLHRFGGLRELAKASREEIAKVDGISDELAMRIHEHFRV
ncbi:MAG: excinuclease ABC subunit UvrC [Legionellaceae bacterium]|nr:excinuclease ABC subunit UvrC [Legionellaceae bacterium]